MSSSRQRPGPSISWPERFLASVLAPLAVAGLAVCCPLAGAAAGEAASALPASETPVAGSPTRLGLPGEEAPCDDPRRVTLGEEWDAYVERSAAVLDSLRLAGADDQARAFALLKLLPEYVAGNVTMDFAWPDALYDQRLLDPGRILRERASDPALQAMASASMAAAARAFDWKLACELAAEAYTLADSATKVGAVYASQAWSVIEFMETALERELGVHRQHLMRALELYRTRRGSQPADWVLRDPEKLWDELRPFMGEAAGTIGGSSCRNPDAADLRTNRFLTTPGVRVSLSVPMPDGKPGPGFLGYRERRGRAFTVWSSLVEKARPLDTPENVMLTYAYAHHARDIDLYRSLLDRDFKSFAVDPGAPPKDFDQEVAATGDLFAQAATINLYMEFERAAPSTQEGFPATEGFWEVVAHNCQLQARQEHGERPTVARVDRMIFVLRKKSSSDAAPWKIVAQIVPR